MFARVGLPQIIITGIKDTIMRVKINVIDNTFEVDVCWFLITLGLSLHNYLNSIERDEPSDKQFRSYCISKMIILIYSDNYKFKRIYEPFFMCAIVNAGANCKACFHSVFLAAKIYECAHILCKPNDLSPTEKTCFRGNPHISKF